MAAVLDVPPLIAVPAEADAEVVITSVFSVVWVGADRRGRDPSSGNARFERLCGFVDPIRGRMKREAKR